MMPEQSSLLGLLVGALMTGVTFQQLVHRVSNIGKNHGKLLKRFDKLAARVRRLEGKDPLEEDEDTEP